MSKLVENMYVNVEHYPDEFLLPMKCESCNNRVARYQSQVEEGLAKGNNISDVVESLGLRRCCSNTIKMFPLSLDTSMINKIPPRFSVGQLSSNGTGFWYEKQIGPLLASAPPRHSKVYNSSDYNFQGYAINTHQVTTDIAEADRFVGWDATNVKPASRLTLKHLQMLRDLTPS